MSKEQTIASFFDRQEPRNFPLPKYRKPYTRIVTYSFGVYVVKASYKDSGSAKIELLVDDEVEQKLFIQGIDYAGLIREAQILQGLVKREGGK